MSFFESIGGFLEGGGGDAISGAIGIGSAIYQSQQEKNALEEAQNAAKGTSVYEQALADIAQQIQHGVYPQQKALVGSLQAGYDDPYYQALIREEKDAYTNDLLQQLDTLRTAERRGIARTGRSGLYDPERRDELMSTIINRAQEGANQIARERATGRLQDTITQTGNLGATLSGASGPLSQATTGAQQRSGNISNISGQQADVGAQQWGAIQKGIESAIGGLGGWAAGTNNKTKQNNQLGSQYGKGLIF